MFPEKFKIARVKPLYKKGDIYSTKNYTPISILSIFFYNTGKVNVQYNTLIIFLNIHIIITEVQNGLREKKSAITAIQSFIEKIQEALDNGLQAIGIFFYLTKAYDVLNHTVLLDKLCRSERKHKFMV
jgi:hypothetical protein